MSDLSKAVFLSYASQDTEAAKRICEALRTAGVEVWFDQSELVGGDAWDQKIRKQIKECALLIPVISANTQARTEGYFRLEWRLADQRTHLMAKGRAFLLPVVIDDTRDFDAHVPDSFTEVQWTRLPDGETAAALALRVKKLLNGEPVDSAQGRQGAGSREQETVGAALRRDRPEGSGRHAPPTRGAKPWLMPVILGAAAIAFATVWFTRKPASAPPMESSPAISPALTGVAAELARIRARIIPDRWQRNDFEALAPTIDRLIQAEPENAEAHALRSIIHSLQVVRLIDPGTQPLEAGKAAADLALRIAPESPLAHLAHGLHLVAMVSRGGDPTACRVHLDRAVAALPPDTLTRYVELVSYWLGYDFEGTERSARAWLAVEPSASFPAWIMAGKSLAIRRPDEAERWAQASINDPNITGIRTLLNLAEMHLYLKADPGGSRALLDRIPLQSRSMARVVHSRWLQAMVEERWDTALQELAQVPDSTLLDVAYNGPKALLAALAHQRAGRAEAAAAQFREAERLLREKLAADSDNEPLRLVLAVTLAGAGRAAEARNELALVEPLVRGRAPNVYRGRLVVAIAQTYAALGDHAAMAQWIRKLFAEPSNVLLTPASFRLDPRFKAAAGAPEIQALLKEFAHLDQAVAGKKEDGGRTSHGSGRATGPGSAAADIGKTEVSAPIDQKSVAVLAFANLSDDKANEYFSDGISEELLNVLAKVPKLKVAARTSSFYFKGKEVPIPEIAQKLGVAYVVEGSVRKAGNKVRITAQLIKAADGFHVWSETYERDLTDIFAVQDEIAKNILGVVKGSLLGEAELPHATTTKIEAYTLYLQGQGAFGRRGVAGLEEAIRLFEAALAIDADYVPALVGLAQARVLVPVYANLSGAKAAAMTVSGRKAAQRALELDPRNATAQVVLGWVMVQTDWRWNEGLERMLRARELAPNNAWIWNILGDHYRFVGDMPQALAAKRREWELDPLSSTSHWDFAYTYQVAGDYDQTIHWAELAIALAPHNLDSYMSAILISAETGRLEKMRTLLAAARREVHENEGMLLLLEARAAIAEKKTDEAHRIMAQVVPLVESGDSTPAYLGYLYLLLGESDQAAHWLQQGYERHDSALVWPENIDFDVIAANPKTRPILDQPGLKELYELRQRNARAGLNKL